MTSPTKSYQVAQIMLYMWSCDQYFEILYRYGKRIKTKSHKVGANSYVCRSYKEKTDREVFLSQPIILNRVKNKKELPLLLSAMLVF